jgi:hypothetical protein
VEFFGKIFINTAGPEKYIPIAGEWWKQGLATQEQQRNQYNQQNTLKQKKTLSRQQT